ncbi:3'(2'),5'-bisphosphate nucleotidase CysQ family protein [Romeriopsis navalis]|uniref:3'(2'),5'-bisphosphate nucleotidase CysQ family protein n=1 Tax=Romeriopsis navalis TaxID=2992132 RepID=UPI0021F8AD28|nr:inositol monophosphatase family protein [Romeriopsis navalis]
MFDRLTEILDLTIKVGWETASILRQAETAFDVEKSGESPVTSADLAANRCILDGLQAALGTEEFAYLSEETYATQPPEARLGKPWVWIIDPLDGTKDFIQGAGEYASHIALTHKGRPVLSVVACPGKGRLYSAVKGQGTHVATQNGDRQRLTVSTKADPKELVLLTSRNHRSGPLENLITQLPHHSQKAVGSIGGKLAAIVEQQADLYLTISGKSAPKDWDFAAPDLILTEAGGKLTTFDGLPLTYNQKDVSQWGGIMASNGPCHVDLCAIANRVMAIDEGWLEG